jgi:hypothetical protein
MSDENILEFKTKVKSKSRGEIFSECVDHSKKYALLWYDESGTLNYMFGNEMTNQELAHINKILDIISTDTIKNNTKKVDLD